MKTPILTLLVATAFGLNAMAQTSEPEAQTTTKAVCTSLTKKACAGKDVENACCAKKQSVGEKVKTETKKDYTKVKNGIKDAYKDVKTDGAKAKEAVAKGYDKAKAEVKSDVKASKTAVKEAVKK